MRTRIKRYKGIDIPNEDTKLFVLFDDEVKHVVISSHMAPEQFKGYNIIETELNNIYKVKELYKQFIEAFNYTVGEHVLFIYLKQSLNVSVES